MALDPEEIAPRLKRVRLALKLNRREMARLVGVTEGNWSYFENGDRRMSLNAALRLYAETGVTLDYIYLGIIDRVPHSLAVKIQAA